MKSKLFVLLIMLIVFNSLNGQNYIQSTTNSAYGNKELTHNHTLRIGHLTTSSERNKYRLKFGDKDYVQIGEWEKDDMLSFKASKYNFTGGNVGIGTSSPSCKLDVNGNLRVNGRINLTGNTHFTFGYHDGNGVINFGAGNSGAFYIRKLAKANEPFGTYYNYFVIGNSGNVGIGTTKMTAKLTVNGKIDCEEIMVKDIGADYVFEDGYNLRSINQVETYISQNGHLPGIDPASVTERGVNLGEFNEKLLEKIEELTLYIIEQNKRIEALETENN